MWWILVGLWVVLSGGPVFADEAETAKPAASGGVSVEAGKVIYEKRCIFCHGDAGMGDGAASERFWPKPRDFNMGLFKYRTTPSGMLPTDEDLFKVVSNGLPGTGMPAWSDILKEEERRSVIQYIKTFSKRFARQKEPLKPIEIGPEIASSAESIEKGKALFTELECFKCHGTEGRGNGPSALELTDDKGDPILPRNLTKNWLFRGGGEPKDIYLRINTGLNGTPMPSFADSLDNEKSWHVANYVRSLSPAKKPEMDVVVRARRAPGVIPTDPNDPLWQEGDDRWFPMVGQVIREPRHFTPTITDVRVKSLYNDNEIGVMVAWDDPSQSKTDESAEIFGDAVAIQFPVELYPGSKKPYFLMGDEKKPVNLWTWKSETGSVSESNATGIDQEKEQDGGSQEVSGGGVYQNGRYRVVMKRSLTTQDVAHDIQFQQGKFVPVAFHAWDGHNKEVATKRAISHWYYVVIEPDIPKSVYIYPPVVAAVVFGLQFLLQRRLRKNHQAGSGKGAS